MTEISKSLEQAIRASVLNGKFSELLPMIRVLSEEKKIICREIYKRAVEERKKLIQEGVLGNCQDD